MASPSRASLRRARSDAGPARAAELGSRAPLSFPCVNERGDEGRSRPAAELFSPVEREIARSYVDDGGRGEPFSRRARQTRRTVENYLAAGYMQRLRDIERELASHERLLARAQRILWIDCGADPAAFARRWTARARAWRFDRINALISEHNEWYPVERSLPLNPRTGDYVQIRGRSYRREPLDAGWVLERFPPSPPADAGQPERRAS